jgi:hypothetical protein
MATLVGERDLMSLWAAASARAAAGKELQVYGSTFARACCSLWLLPESRCMLQVTGTEIVVDGGGTQVPVGQPACTVTRIMAAFAKACSCHWHCGNQRRRLTSSS